MTILFETPHSVLTIEYVGERFSDQNKAGTVGRSMEMNVETPETPVKKRRSRKTAAPAVSPETASDSAQPSEAKRRGRRPAPPGGGTPKGGGSPETVAARKQALKCAVEALYDLQKTRIAVGNRAARQAEPAHLEDEQKAFFDELSGGLDDLEKQASKRLPGLLRGIPIWEEYLSAIKGVGPTLGAIIVGGFDIAREHTVSQMWAYAGLAVDSTSGRARRARKGMSREEVRACGNRWLKAKMLKVLADCLLKANNEQYRKIYDDRKHRQRNRLVPTCARCEGSGKEPAFKADLKSPSSGRDLDDAPEQAQIAPKPKKVRKPGGPCENCAGTGGPAPWGAGDGHRNADARRYMVKMFLANLWERWRALEGLPGRQPYAVEKLGRAPHGEYHEHQGGER